MSTNTSSPPPVITIEVVAWADERAAALRTEMDAEIGPRYADRLAGIEPGEAERMTQALAVDPRTIVVTVLASADGRPVGHAALRDLGSDFDGSLEVKRVFVTPEARGTGVSRLLLAELERLATERAARRLILQTGDRQPEAVALYQRLGYTPIPVYPPYLPITFSQCYAKELSL